METADFVINSRSAIKSRSEDQSWKKPEVLDRAYALTRMAVPRLRLALHRMTLLRPNFIPGVIGLLSSSAELALANWHFKIDKAKVPLRALDMACQLFQRMLLTAEIASRESNPRFPIFRLSDATDAVAYAHLGGFYASPIDVARGRGVSGMEPESCIYLTRLFAEQSARDTDGKLVKLIIHELGHYCGGKIDSLDWIGHMASPIPKPNGSRKEDGRHNYRDMTSDEAVRNTYSYTLYALPELGYGPPSETNVSRRR
ncbi:hypothetical protein [Sorangium sp. So ce1389]|uniref:hypothetical protein n=1 Tax=Sorangium sp. So ce1389 TaxID=3133336 RepID=UPI003F614933